MFRRSALAAARVSSLPLGLCSGLGLCSALALCVLGLVVTTAAAQERAAGQAGAGQGAAVPEEVERMVREGMTEALEARLAGGRTTDDKRLIAQAWANRARRGRDAADRKRLFEKADEKYKAWITALETAARGGAVADRVRLVAGRVAYGGMLLSGPAAPELDEYELTLGQRGDKATVLKVLEAARGQYEQAARDIAPLIEDRQQNEEELLAAGLYDTLQQSRLDLALNTGWTRYYLGVLSDDATRKREHLGAAERSFQELINEGQVGPARAACYLGLAMTQRAQGQHDAAEKAFATALEAGEGDAAVTAQARYELARSQLERSKFDEARTTLKPLVEKDPQSLSQEDRPARFYINLAHVWDAYSYLKQADQLRAEARDSASSTARIQQAQRTREAGLNRFKRLGAQGGPWPALVQLYLAQATDLSTPMDKLTALELYYTAGTLMEARKLTEAQQRLQLAAGRAGEDAELLGDILFELGRCQYQLRGERAAAETFALLAREHRAHAKAAQAATFAYQLWGKVADTSRKPDDYVKLADVLLNLLESYADHPDRDEAQWLLPVALQLAGKPDEAAARFAKVPESSRHFEEAQYRRVLCARLAWEISRTGASSERTAQGSTVGDDPVRKAGRQVAAALSEYAAQSRGRAREAINRDEVLRWSAEALAAAGEVLVQIEEYDAALKTLADFEAQYAVEPGTARPVSTQPSSAESLLGRVLATRIRARRGLREFDQAAQMLQQFLLTAGPAQIGGTLGALAKGMQEEVQRLQADGQADEARKLAADSVQTFTELERWVRADPARAAMLDFVLQGRAEMHFLAGQHPEAERLIDDLLTKNPHNGNAQYLRARVRSAQLDLDAPGGTRTEPERQRGSPADLKAAQDAWGALLADPAIRQRAPERYWEARYNWLALALRLGAAADVEKAISQERVWYPDLGGEPWKARLEALWVQARGQLGLPAETQP